MAWTDTPLENAVASSRRIGDRTRLLYLRRVQAFITFAGPHPSSWTAANLERWRDHLIQTGIRPQTTNVYMSAVRFAAKRMQQLGTGQNMMQGAERARIGLWPASPRVLDADECRDLIATCSDWQTNPVARRDRAMILVGIHAAFRRTELCSIQFENVALHQITVVAKGRKMHTVQLDDHGGWRALQDWIRWLGRHEVNEGSVFRSLRPSVDHEWFIGESLTPGGFYGILKKRAKEADIEGLHPHVLRHTFASLAIQNNVPGWRIKKVLGHKTDIMMERYLHDLSEGAVGGEFPNLEE